ncbi:MAG: LAGLIDADG family homing endonuclease [archaeon]|jgi:hypothetical protein|nr:LAGLIDADG family homing endonuclease [archaeon]
MAKEEAIAEFVGIMLGDGHIGIYNTKAGDKMKLHRTIKVSLDSRNKQYIDYVKGIMRSVLEVEPHLNYKKKENAVDIATHKKDKLDYLLNEIGLKISPKWEKMKIPEPYSKGKLGLLVLKGLFDTDGCLSVYDNNGVVYPRIEIRLCPSPAQEQVSAILSEFGFEYKVQNLERGKTRVRISGKKQLEKWFELIGSANSTHINKAKHFLNS